MFLFSKDKFACTCLSIYTGTQCETLINPCTNNLCAKQTSVCVGITGTLNYVCSCAVGYRGVYCDTRIPACESNPCVNGNYLRLIKTIKAIIIIILF